MACSESEEHFGTSVYTLHLDSTAPSFGTQTRAKNGGWKDGDVIYLLFANGGSNSIESRAVYNAASQDWALYHFDTRLNQAEGSCKVHHFRGGVVESDNNNFSISEHTASYADVAASYTIIEDDIYVTAHLLPQTWRLAFKGESGKTLTVSASSNIEYYSTYSPLSGLQGKKTKDYHLIIQPNGYTDFLYGSLSTSPSTLQIILDNKIYCRLIDNSLLSLGQTGYFKLPTEDNSYGWDYGGLSSTEICLEGFSTDRNLDDTTGSPTEQTGSQDISLEGNSEDKDLDGTTGGPTETTGSQNISIEGYGPDKNLD